MTPARRKAATERVLDRRICQLRAKHYGDHASVETMRDVVTNDVEVRIVWRDGTRDRLTIPSHEIDAEDQAG